MASLKVIVLGSKLASKDEASNLHLCTTIDMKEFWTREPILGGTICQVTEKKAGDKYYDSNNQERIVKKDGLIFNFVIGTAGRVAEIAASKAALATLDTI
jgi:hypothetical protein